MIWVGCEKPGDNLISRAIAKHDAPGLYSHAALWFETDVVCEAHIQFGVKFRQYAPDLNRWTLWPIGTMPSQEAALRLWCELRAGDKYDLCGVTAFKIRAVKQDPNKWFCSELVVAALQQIGVAAFANADASRISPNLLSLMMDELAKGDAA